MRDESEERVHARLMDFLLERLEDLDHLSIERRETYVSPGPRTRIDYKLEAHELNVFYLKMDFIDVSTEIQQRIEQVAKRWLYG